MHTFILHFVSKVTFVFAISPVSLGRFFTVALRSDLCAYIVIYFTRAKLSIARSWTDRRTPSDGSHMPVLCLNG